MSDYLFDKTGDDPSVAELEGLLGAYAHRAPLGNLRLAPSWPNALDEVPMVLAAVDEVLRL